MSQFPKWRVVIDDGYGFPHAYEIRASESLSAHTFLMCVVAGLRLFGVVPKVKDLYCYLGSTEPITVKKRSEKG